MRKMFGALAVAAMLAGPVLAQEGVAQETEEGKQSPEGGAYGAGADVNESEAHGIVNWWSWDYDTGGHHAKDPAHKGWPAPFGYALINFGIFVAIMLRFARKPFQQFVSDRHDTIAKNLDEAAKLRAEAEATLKKYEQKIAGIDGEIDALLATIRKEAEADKARIMAAAEADAKRLKEDAERQIAAEIEAARRELRRGVIEAAVAAAEQSLKKNIAADDQRKMAEKYVADVEARARHKDAGRLS